MSSSDAAEEIFEQVDANKDGVIDQKELHDWVSNGEGLTSRSYEFSTHGQDRNDNTSSRLDRYTLKETTLATSNLTSDKVIHTNSSEETKRYLERFGANVYVDRNPQIIRRTTTERPQTYEQRVFLRCLQPPPLPPAEPLIIKEVRPEQRPPSPLIVREQASYAISPAPLILRERPPLPPARIPGETVTRYLPPLPVPPRSLIVERLPSAPQKPRDIIIERWIPYGPDSERRTIVQAAPPPVQYSAATHTVIVYDTAPSNIVRKFERLGITQENPDAYIARYGASLLDPATLMQHARNAGVTEDITCTCPRQSVSISANTRGTVTYYDQSNDVINQSYASSGGYGYERNQRVAGNEPIHFGSGSYSTSASHYLGDSASADSVKETRYEYRSGDASTIATNT